MNNKRLMLVLMIVIIPIAMFIIPSITGGAIISGAVITDGVTVSLDYTGTLANGTVFDTSIGRVPLSFTTGQDQMIPGFEAAVIGMSVGQEKTFTLSPSEAYGEPLSELVIEYNRTELETSLGAEVTEGMTLMTSTGAQATIVGVSDVNVTVDFNHPLAGKELTFTIKILSIT